MAKKLTHLDEQGRAQMVDVGQKPVQQREAIAEGSITLQSETVRAIAEEKVPKGEVLNTARIAGAIARGFFGDGFAAHDLALRVVLFARRFGGRR